MKRFLYRVTIIDNFPVFADSDVFPKIELLTAIAENEEEAQRNIVEQLFTPDLGTCEVFSAPDDLPDRFSILFGDDPEVTEVDLLG